VIIDDVELLHDDWPIVWVMMMDDYLVTIAPR
jgi:hypothetical protein